MKKLICLILAAGMVFLLTACDDARQNGETQDLFGDSEDETNVDLAEAYHEYRLASFSLTGGDGFLKRDGQLDALSYSGGEMSINIRTVNDRFASDYGIYVVINGIHQLFTLTLPDGTVKSADYMQSFELDADESADLTLTFTPNTGNKGEKLSLFIPSICQPSYETDYTGFGRYGHYIEHEYACFCECTLIMEADAPVKMPAAELKTEVMDIPENYADTLSFYFGAEGDIDMGDNLINVPAGDTATFYLDVWGVSDSYRASLFINHALVPLADGSSYMQFDGAENLLTRISFTADISALSQNNHAYIVICGKNDSNPYAEKDQYSVNSGSKTPTHYFVIGNLPDSSEEENNAEETFNMGEGISLDEESNALSELLDNKMIHSIYMADSSTVCFVLLSEESEYGEQLSVYFYSSKDKKITGKSLLSSNCISFGAGDGCFFTAGDPLTENAEITVYSADGEIVKSFVYNSGINASGASGNWFIGTALSVCEFSPDCGELLWSSIADNVLALNVTDIKAQTRKEVPFFDTDAVCCGFSGENILFRKTMDGKSSFTLCSLSGQTIKELDFSGSKLSYINGNFAVLCDYQSSIAEVESDCLPVLNISTGEEREVTLKAKNEGRRAYISDDGKVLLTNDMLNTLRLYDVFDNTLITEIPYKNATYLYPGSICIDTGSKTVYLPARDNGVYGAEIVNY